MANTHKKRRTQDRDDDWVYIVSEVPQHMSCSTQTNKPNDVRSPMLSIRESVDSLCRDGADTPMSPYIEKPSHAQTLRI